ncbi:MAG: hypothetical protein HON70_24535, partial [Lentisphaerae bacterium]|nr:hypothetical protein [Lentisphaerota bacterium]
MYKTPLIPAPVRKRLARTVLIGTWLAAAQILTAAPPSRKALFSFAKGPEKWSSRTYGDDGKPSVAALPATAVKPGEGLTVAVKLPGKNEYVAPIARELVGWESLNIEVVFPENLPSSAVIAFFTKDWDHLWRQVRVQVPDERGVPVRFSLPLTSPMAELRWKPFGHERPWHPMTAGQITEFGCCLELDTGATDTFTGTVVLKEVWLAGTTAGQPPPADAVRNYGANPSHPTVGKLCELSFEWHGSMADPFDPRKARVTTSVKRPDGKEDVLQGFYFEDFLYNPGIEDMTKCLTPYGHPLFKVRYTPMVPGKHTAQTTLKFGLWQKPLPALTFDAAAPTEPFRGYLRIDKKDSRFLAWDNGDPLWGIGMNVRSPFDTRYVATVPYTQWRDEGLPLYDRLFATLSENHINVVEVWMCSWWLALEWINDAPGFHGVGHMNQYRAWMLDHILRKAEQYGISLILVFNNHGKFGTMYDTEWARNPFNTKNGGFLNSCEEYFTDARAKAAFKKLADYVVARWGYSPNIMAWKLFTEVDLTGTSYTFYTTPPVTDWHREMGRYIKSIDLHDHLITTHWMLSYKRINSSIAELPEVDFLTTDAYYQGGGSQQMLALIRGGHAYGVSKRKPLLVTEFGGSPYADNMENLMKQAHLGVWTGFFCGSPVPPLFWWFALVDEKDMYGIYPPLHRFGVDEDRRGMKTAVRTITSPALALSELRGSGRVLIWGIDSEYYFAKQENVPAKEHAGVQ